MHVTYVHGDDWCGLYRNGRLSLEGHSLPIGEVMRSIENQGSIHYHEFEVDQTWLENQGSLPSNLGDIPLEVRSK